MKKILIIFFIALALRVTGFITLGPLIELKNTHSLELIYNSMNLETHPYFTNEYKYSKWYERTPGQVLYLHIIHRNILITILISALSCVILYKIIPAAGWLWVFNPQEIIYSFQYGKETLMIFLIISAIYLFRKNIKWLMLAVPIIMTGFISYNTNHGEQSAGFINNIMNLWKPSFDISVLYSKWFVYIQAPVYMILLWFFIRNVNFFSTEIFLIAGFSIIYGLVYSEPHYRDPLIPIILISVFKTLNIKDNDNRNNRNRYEPGRA